VASLKEVMRYALELDTSDFGKGLDRASADAKGTFDDIEQDADKSSSRFEGFGGKMGTALVAGFAAIGVGALLMQGIQQSLDKRAGERLLQGQFDLTAQEAKHFGGIAGDLYADGWGQGLEEVQQVVGLTARKLSTTTDEELSKISRQVLAVSKTWGEDFDSVIRSTDQLVQNDLAPNAEAALDLIVAAFQNGGNEAGDLLDTIDEYSQHWSAMGLSGEEALNQIVHGFQNGQRDADKMADAVKEMRIRVVEDSDRIDAAYSDLGLNADKLRSQFLAGGDAARDAFKTVIGALQSVEDPVEQNRLAIELIGTQYEDLGPKALDSLAAVDGALDVTTGKAEKLAETVGDERGWAALQREGEGALTSVGDYIAGEVMPGLEGAHSAVDGLKSGFGLWGDSAEGDAAKVGAALRDDVAKSATMVETAILESKRAVGDLEDDATRSFSLVEQSIYDAKDAVDETASAAEILGTQADLSLNQAERAAQDAERAIRDIEYAVDDLQNEMSDRTAYLDVQDSFDDVREAGEAAWTAASEGSEDADRLARIYERTVWRNRQEVIEYAREVGNIPAQRLTDILALIDQGKFEQAESALAWLERERETVITARVVTVGNPDPRGGPVERHSGGRVTPGQEITPLSGETFIADRAGRVASREDVNHHNTTAGATVAPVTNISLTVNAGMGTDANRVGRQIVDALEEFYRNGGKPPRSQRG
jgi:hypothetical protein